MFDDQTSPQIDEDLADRNTCFTQTDEIITNTCFTQTDEIITNTCFTQTDKIITTKRNARIQVRPITNSKGKTIL